MTDKRMSDGAPMRMTDEIAWLIERGDSRASAPEYLVVVGSNSDSPHSVTGTFAWTPIVHHALRFARKLDATMFVGALRDLSNHVPHGQTIPGMRSGDASPRVCEHAWMD